MNKETFRRLVTAASLAGAALAVTAISAPLVAKSAPTTLHDANSVSLPASVEDVWAKLGQFEDLTWVPAVKASTATKGNEVGSVRSLDFGGGTLTETLVAYSAVKHSYTYRIDDTAENRKLAPVSGVVATISVAPGKTGGSVLTWSFNFRRLDASATAAAGADDAAARKQIAATIAMGMSGAATKFPAN